MRPNKRINSGAHRSGTAASGKGRHFTTGLPPRVENPAPEAQDSPPPESHGEPSDKYAGRATVAHGSGAAESEVTIDLAHEEWVDPLDNDEVDLSSITIDLRPTMRTEPPDTYYQRHSSKVPGHQSPE